ncbi:MAG: FAD-dependent oxidoreductase [Candidatus Nanohaloarchaea archaeon]|nr:FAD-dependent oxidoreductase [Candidatus Nanohaloarchaea archaeon]
MDRELIIIGGGPAGCSAAVYAARSRIDTLLVTEDFGGQLLLTDSVENYLGLPGSTGTSISEDYEEHVRDYDIDIERTRVQSVEQQDSGFSVTMDDGTTTTAEAVIIATGTEAQQLGIPGEEEYTNQGIGYCAVCDGPLFPDETVAVIGGGYSGTEAAVFLSDIAEKVYIINYEAELTGEPITLEKLPDLDNVEVHNYVEPLAFDGDGQLQSLRYRDRETGDEQEIEIAAAFIEIGRTPNTELIDDIKTDEDDKIVTDSRCRTSIQGLYAAGDVSDIEEEQAIVAAGEGCIAALDAATYLKDQESLSFSPRTGENDG